MMHKGSHMQMMSDPMAAELLIYKVAMSVSIIRNDLAYLIELHTGLALVYSRIHRLPCYLRESMNVGVNFR